MLSSTVSICKKTSTVNHWLLWPCAVCLLSFGSAAFAHLSPNRFEALIPADSPAAIETYLEAATGLDVTVTHYGSIDWATQGNGVGVSIAGDLVILIQQAADLDAQGYPFYGLWELAIPFPPTINYMVASFDAGSSIGVQYALYAHDVPGNDIFSSGFFQTDDFADGSGDHGFTDFSIYNVAFVPDGDLAPRGALDGEVESGDVLLCQQIVLGLITPTFLEIAHADLYPAGAPDGVITNADCLLMQREALQM